ncbi:MAG: ribonuclease HII [Anaerovoracaceae bacterium]
MKKAEREQMMRERLARLMEFDNRFITSAVPYAGGVDEVGRGPLAGPVVAACVVLPRDFDIIEVYDSKKLSEKKRNEVAPLIKEKALAYGLGMASEKVIDEINILEATRGAMKAAVHHASQMLEERVGEGIGRVLIDAVTIKDLGIPQTSIMKGDQTSASIAAASIFAKVTRDDMMIKYAEQYPGYAFEKNKGYGTREHYEGIEKFGLCPIHRRTFLKNYL